jgi:hypothetical protein
MAQSSLLQLPYELVGGATLGSPPSSRAVFANRWLQSLPRRWARNGAVFGAIYSYAQVGGSKSWEQLFNNGYELCLFVFGLAFMTLSSGLIFFLVGLWARRALSPAGKAEWTSIAKSVLRKWVLGANLLGLLMILAEVVFEWRGPLLYSGGSAEAVASNMGVLVGTLIFWSIIGVAIGFVSRRGLRQAITDDELCVQVALS